MGIFSLQNLIKVFLTAILIVVISQAAKSSRIVGAVIASLPLTSLLALSWLYYDTKQVEPVANLSWDIFWAVIPSLAFFPVLALMLRAFHLPYVYALLISCGVTAIAYYAFFAIVRPFGILNG